MKALTCLICLILVTVESVEEDPTKKYLSFVELHNENDARKLNFPNVKELFLIKPTINNLTTAILYQLEAKQVHFIWGTINVAYITPQFKQFRLTESKLTSLTIDPTLDYQVDTLFLDTNNLTALPANLNALKNLKLLSIEHNQIETINAEDFDGLAKLNMISLAYNNIVHISASSAHPTVLPNLQQLYLSENQLRNVSFVNWSGPSMKRLFLNSNQLTIAQSVFEPFPKLQFLSIKKNQLNCDWLKYVKQEAKTKKVELDDYLRCKETGESMEELIERIKSERF